MIYASDGLTGISTANWYGRVLMDSAGGFSCEIQRRTLPT